MLLYKESPDKVTRQTYHFNENKPVFSHNENLRSVISFSLRKYEKCFQETKKKLFLFLKKSWFRPLFF